MKVGQPRQLTLGRGVNAVDQADKGGEGEDKSQRTERNDARLAPPNVL
jgi:hypothetical protein